MNGTEKRAKKQNIQRAILEAVAGAGLLSVALMMPNAGKFLAPIANSVQARTSATFRIRRSFWRLVEQGFLAREETVHGTFFGLTEKGKKRLMLLQKKHIGAVATRKRWDGRWRVIIFDIDEKRKGVREKFRETVRSVGFVQLQKSVWAYPYDCEDLITLLKAECGVGRAVLYMVVDAIEFDAPLRKHFKLPPQK